MQNKPKILTRREFLALSLSVPLSAILFPTGSRAMGLIAGATEFTQIANNIELIMQYATQVQQYATQLENLQNDIEQLNTMMKNLESLPSGAWNHFINQMVNLKNIVQQSEAITFAASNLDSQFNAMYPGYAGYEAFAAQQLGQRTTSFSDHYKKINRSMRDNINGQLKSLKLQMDDFNTDASTIATLQNQSRNADGNLKVLQAANEIALHQTEENKKLRWTLMTQANTQAAWVSAQNEKATAQRALSERRQQYNQPDINRAGNTRRYENWR